MESLPALTGGQVIDYVIGWTTAASPVAVDMVTLPALRSLLRFLHAAGHDSVAAGRGGARRASPTGPGRDAAGGVPVRIVRAVLSSC